MAGPLRTYEVELAGRRVLFRLNQTDVQRLGGTPATGTDPDAASASDQPTEEKARQPPNKAKTPLNKAPNKAPSSGNG